MNYKILLFSAVLGTLCSSMSIVDVTAKSYDSDTEQAIATSARAEQEAENKEFQSSGSSTVSDGAVASVSGFYAGIDLGANHLKNKFTKSSTSTNLSDAEKAALNKKKSKTGFNGDIFAGYNCQFGKFVIGLECLVGMSSLKNSTPIESGSKETSSAKKRYSFGITPKVGYMIFGGFMGYVNFGTAIAKYTLKNISSTGTQTKKSPSKASMFVGVGVEQNFGALFVRGECNRVFKKTLGTLDSTKISSNSEYVFKIGGGYRF